MFGAGQGVQAIVTAGSSNEGACGPAELDAHWRAIRQGLRRDIGAKLFDQWLRPVRIGQYCDTTGALELLAPSEFSANYCANHFGDRLSLAWRARDAGVRLVRFGTGAQDIGYALDGDSDAQADEAAEGMGADLHVVPAVPRPLSLNRFDNFVVGNSNRLAFEAARAMAGRERPAFSPLFLQGGTGQGKTHLLGAIADAYGALRPHATIIQMSAERFMYEFVSAIRANDTIAFKTRLRGADLLLIDDIQFITGKASQEEFLHTIDELAGSGARLVISADRPPQSLAGFDERILSRLAGGLVADIGAADRALRQAILEAKCAERESAVPAEVISFLAGNITRNIRELEGALNKVVAYAALTGRTVDLAYAQDVLADAVTASARRITIDEIQKATAQHFKIDASEMQSKRRARAVARPRQVAMYLAKAMTPRSLPEIGRRFGGRDHSTVIHAVRAVTKLRQEDPEFDADLRALTRRIEAR